METIFLVYDQMFTGIHFLVHTLIDIYDASKPLGWENETFPDCLEEQGHSYSRAWSRPYQPLLPTTVEPEHSGKLLTSNDCVVYSEQDIAAS